MKDVQTVLESYEAAMVGGIPFALATIVRVEGSAYRRPGARMLVYTDGRRFGSLSGGCLEADVAQHAQETIATGEPTLLRYDPHRLNGDLILETGCKGALEILVESGSNAEVTGSLDFLAALRRERKTGVIATVFAMEGSQAEAIRVGDRLFAVENEVATGALACSPLAAEILCEVAHGGPTQRTRVLSCRTPHGVAHLLLETRYPPIALILCGAGHDTVPLVALAVGQGWQVTVADPNASALTAERYPGAHRLVPTRPECFTVEPPLDRRTAVVLMTHNYALDRAWFRRLLTSPVAYIGVLGPRLRWLEIQRDLIADTDGAAEWDFTRVHSPAGLDIGSETPEEIALAIVAEIQAILSGREGGCLRLRPADPPVAAPAASTRHVTLPEGSSCPLSES